MRLGRTEHRLFARALAIIKHSNPAFPELNSCMVARMTCLIMDQKTGRRNGETVRTWGTLSIQIPEGPNDLNLKKDQIPAPIGRLVHYMLPATKLAAGPPCRLRGPRDR